MVCIKYPIVYVNQNALTSEYYKLIYYTVCYFSNDAIRAVYS